MSKTAVVRHPIHEFIAERWSPRAFERREISSSDLGSLFEAARWAPSAYNDQPWNFIVARRGESDVFAPILDCLVEGNRVWAKEAAVLMIAVARTAFRHNGKPNRHAIYDTGQAVAWMSVQATALGLRVHQMGGFSTTKVRDLLGVPDGYEPITALALGYEGDPRDLPETLQLSERAERQRNTVDEFVHSPAWGHKRADLT